MTANTNIVVNDEPPFEIKVIEERHESVRGYHVISTGPINVEGYELKQNHQQNQIQDSPQRITDNNCKQIKAIADFLRDDDDSQITVSVHGYSIPWKEVEKRHEKIYRYAEKVCQSGKHIFISYRWPAENPIKDRPADEKKYATVNLLQKIRYAFQALPTLLVQLFSLGCFLGIFANLLLCLQISLGFLNLPLKLNNLLIWGFLIVLLTLLSWKLNQYTKTEQILPKLPIWILCGNLIISLIVILLPLNLWGTSLLLLINFLFAFLLVTCLALILLRQSTYLRDRYRAGNYGVVDLIELIRKIDREINRANPDRQKKVKLNFIAHSLGCFLVVDLVRVLSNVFDSEAIEKRPNKNIGNTLELGRLVLVAPDIPVDSILPGRANFLRSALRRFKEAYVFSNEGDLALRLASTAANYLRFPNRTRFRGYKLGNLTVKTNRGVNYGIVNPDGNNSSEYLEIRSSKLERRELKLLLTRADFEIADKFSYFDCTHYTDYKKEPIVENEQKLSKDESKERKVKLLSNASKNQEALGLGDYVKLSYNYFFQGNQSVWINTHGGYFEGEFSQRLIYGLALMGWNKFLNFYQYQQNTLSQQCKSRQIQVILSSEANNE